jgi:hypothetical protein
VNPIGDKRGKRAILSLTAFIPTWVYAIKEYVIMAESKEIFLGIGDLESENSRTKKADHISM